MKGNYVAALAATMLALVAVGCGKGEGGPQTKHAAVLGEALSPAFFAAALHKAGGAHYHATLRYAVGRVGTPPLAITTTTDVWLDRAGNYRLVEENDRDGGRAIVLHGRELAVALRYGKMIRRVAEEPEPARLLQEGLGGPWAAFELAAPRLHVEKTGAQAVGAAHGTVYTLALGHGPGAQAPQPALPFTGLRGWRGTATIDSASGRAVVDGRSGALLRFDLSVAFRAKGDGGPEQGTVEVHATSRDLGTTAPIAAPAAEELSLRQRTVPEAHALLRGLASPTRNPAAPRERHP